MLRGKEVRRKHLLPHRRRHRVPPPPGQRRHDDGAVHEALMIGGEDHGTVEIAKVFAAVDLKPRKRSRERQNPEWQVHAPDGARHPRPRPRRELHRLGRRRFARRRAVHQLTELSNIARFRERALVYPRLKRVFERHHQFHALQRAQSQLLERRLRRQIGAAGVFREQDDERIAAGLRETRRRRTAFRPFADRGALQLARAFRARQLGLGPHQRPANLLWIVEHGVRGADHGVGICACLEQQHSVYAFFRSDRHADDGGIADAG